MTGAGFGGCTINLVRPEAVDDLRAAVESSYPARTGFAPRVFPVTPVAGSRADGRVTVRLDAGSDRAIVDPAAGGRLASLVAGGRERLDRPGPARVPLPRHQLGQLPDGTLGRADPGRPGRLAGPDVPAGCKRRGPRDPRGRLRGPLAGRSASPAAWRCAWRSTPARWPLGGHLHQRISLRPGSLECAASITATEPMPAALGWHPWFRRGPDEDLGLDRRRPTGASSSTTEMIPAGPAVAVEGPFDLRSGPTLGDRRLDDVFIGARSPAIVAWPDLELRIAF